MASRGTIDLTGDSDDEGPLNAFFSPPKPKPKPKMKTPIPIHENVRHLYPNHPASSSRSPSITTPNNAQRNGNVQNGYVSVYGPVPNQTANAFSAPQAGKRRKLSVPSAATHSPSNKGLHKPKPARKSIPGASLPGPSHFVSTQAATPDVNTMRFNANNLPSVQDLNTALKSNGTPMQLARDLISLQPRILQFGRSTDEANNFGTSKATLPDEMIVDRDLDQDSMEELCFRTSPLKKTLPPPRQQNLDQSYSVSGANLPTFASGSIPPSLPKKSSSSSSVPRQSSPLSSGPTPEQEDDRDSVILETTAPNFPVVSTTSNTPNRPRIPRTEPITHTGLITEDERDLLIYLKEVENLTWNQIVEQFSLYYKGRSYSKLQSFYSTKLGKRDRSKDSPTLNLPVGFVAGAAGLTGSVEPRIPSRKEVNYEEPQRESPVYPRPFAREPADYSSGAEQAPRYQRPQRTGARKDYTWPTRFNQFKADVVEDDDIEFTGMGMQLGSEEPSEVLDLAPAKAIAVDNDPVNMEFEKEDAQLAISAQRQLSSGQKMPYVSSSQRLSIQNPAVEQEWDQLCSRDWQGALVHVDFSPEELDVVERAISKVLNPTGAFSTRAMKKKGRRKRLQKSLQELTEPKLLNISYQIRRHLFCRTEKSIAAFLQDARIGQIQVTRPRIERLAAARPSKDHGTDQKLSTASMIRQRELGLQSRRGWKVASQPVSYQWQNKMHDSLGPTFKYTGAAGDVHAVAWSPDGECFAGGAICVDDPHSMQYNRPNNLLYGDVSYGVMHELGQHRVQRPRTESGPNSTHAMFASQDPKLYKTVTSVAFSPDGRFMFSGGYDHNVYVWETKSDGSQPDWRVAWKHKAPVDILAVNRSGLLATASKKWDHAVKTIRILGDNPEHITKENFSSKKATDHPENNFLPTALQFSPICDNLLLAGFGANVRLDGRDKTGDICLWDVNYPQIPLAIHGTAYNVFDLSFHPRHNWFAVGCVAGQGVNRGTKSILRIYDNNNIHSKYSSRTEIECDALDINDVIWCPGHDSLIAVGCTSGQAYVWDVRKPDQFLRKLSHHKSLMPLDDFQSREATDTGVRFLSWGDNATRLYTGSSDGVVKVWNVARSEEETFVKDLITTNSGIMSGAFSPDRSKLILGEVNGSVNILEVGCDDYCSNSKDVKNFKFIPYMDDNDDDEEDDQATTTAPNPDSGVATANKLIQTGQLSHVPMGGLPIQQAVQGPNYAGPFDTSVEAPFLRQQALDFQLSLSRNIGPQCDIRGCADVVKITDEETGDSGRSADRIPDELRKQWKLGSSDLQVILPGGKSRCMVCGRAARPSPTGDADLCERCSFSCFRCGAVNEVPHATETLSCGFCNCKWEIGALGYQCVRDPGTAAQISSEVPLLKRFGRELLEYKMLAEEKLLDNASFGDEMNALTDYYYGLDIGGPESPPL